MANNTIQTTPLRGTEFVQHTADYYVQASNSSSTLLSLYVMNTGNTDALVQIHDAAALGSASNTTAKMTLLVPANNGSVSVNTPVQNDDGILVVASSTAAAYTVSNTATLLFLGRYA